MFYEIVSADSVVLMYLSFLVFVFIEFFCPLSTCVVDRTAQIVDVADVVSSVGETSFCGEEKKKKKTRVSL